MSIGWRRWLPEAREGTEMEAIFQRAEVSCGTAAKESINQTDRHSRLSPNGELANLARFACQSVFAQDRGVSLAVAVSESANEGNELGLACIAAKIDARLF